MKSYVIHFIRNMPCEGNLEARFLLDGNGLENAPGVGQSALPVLNPTKLSTEYPLYAPSLFELVQNTEQAVLEKNNP